MGAFGITRGQMREEIANIVGVRVGLALSPDRVDRLINEALPSLGPALTDGLRMRSSAFEDLVFSALASVGDPWTAMGPLPRGHAFRDMGERSDLYIAATNLLHREVHEQGLAGNDYHPRYDPLDCVVTEESAFPHVMGWHDSYVLDAKLTEIDEGRLLGLAMFNGGPELRRACKLLLNAQLADQRLSPWSRVRRHVQAMPMELDALFTASGGDGAVFDQRFIDFLAKNLDDLDRIHWRQFEKLCAEYFRRQGYHVLLGPGRDDDGVDLRVWPNEGDSAKPPLLIVQCKRQGQKVGKVTVKALWADVVASSAFRGLLATTSLVLPGATKTIQTRGYDIVVADRHAVSDWLTAMRTPRTGCH